MTMEVSTLSIPPRHPRARRAWVVFRLKLKGSSLSAVARKHGVSPQAVSNALDSPSAPIEAALAAELEVDVQQLFPERFDANGNRLIYTRERSTAAMACNSRRASA